MVELGDGAHETYFFIRSCSTGISIMEAGAPRRINSFMPDSCSAEAVLGMSECRDADKQRTGGNLLHMSSQRQDPLSV